jgi:hypothetical protein
MPQSTRIAVAILKLALGTSFYIVLISVARLFPTAAGMMLTFPALNGLTLVAAPQRENVAGATRTMLFMPVLNCLLCALYVFAFLWLNPKGALFELIAALGVIWVIIAGSLVLQKVEIRCKRNQLVYVCVCTLALVILLLAFVGYTPERTPISTSDSNWWQFMEQNWGKLALFAICLTTVILVSDFLSLWFSSSLISRLLGVLGGFPLVPFFGLYTVAYPEGKSVGERLDAFGSFAVSIWFGPVVAFGFIILFSEHLLRRGRYEHGQWLTRFAWAFPFWAGCFGVIIPATMIMEALRR